MYRKVTMIVFLIPLIFLGNRANKESVTKIYRNITGPGEYESPIMTGRLVVESSRKNQPSFSFGHKHDYYSKKSPIISKNHLADFMLRDSPGAGTYSPEDGQKKFTQTSLRFSIPKDSRFKGPGSENLNHKKYVLSCSKQ